MRQAVLDSVPGDTIAFSGALLGATITLTSGEIPITTNLTIAGLAADRLTISGNAASRIFTINPGVTATISGMTLTNGRGTDGKGGAIQNGGTLSLLDLAIINSVAQAANGGNSGKKGLTRRTEPARGVRRRRRRRGGRRGLQRGDRRPVREPRVVQRQCGTGRERRKRCFR